MAERFWMVNGAGPTQVLHDTRASAEAEAERLAKKAPGRFFHVLETVAAYRLPVARLERYSSEGAAPVAAEAPAPQPAKGAAEIRLKALNKVRRWYGEPEYTSLDLKVFDETLREKFSGEEFSVADVHRVHASRDIAAGVVGYTVSSLASFNARRMKYGLDPLRARRVAKAA